MTGFSMDSAPNSCKSTPALAALKALLGDRVTTSLSVMDQHGRDESWHPPQRPDAVTFPVSTEEVSQICKICTEYRLPIIGFGAGSSVEGALIPTQGGVVISTEKLNALLNVDEVNFDCRVQPGMRRRALNEHLRATGLFFTVDPGADASVGGMAATRASGTNAIRYGTMADVVRGLEVVLADGRVIRTGTRARKSASGYDLTGLIVGSEGTLGIITELTLKLSPQPTHIRSAVCRFAELEQAVAAAVMVQQYGLPVARLELLDDVMIEAVNAYSKTTLETTTHLFLEFHGALEDDSGTIDAVAEIVAENGGSEFNWANNADDRNALWRARHDCAYACMAFQRPKRMMTCDVCVPLSVLAESILAAREDARNSGFIAPILGHVGDGNFHMVLLIDPENNDEVARAKDVSDRLVERALSVGGTATGEHGIGLGKRAYLEKEHGVEAVETMKAIKAALDPNALMNPGKVLP